MVVKTVGILWFSYKHIHHISLRSVEPFKNAFLWCIVRCVSTNKNSINQTVAAVEKINPDGLVDNINSCGSIFSLLPSCMTKYVGGGYQVG